MKTQRRFKNKQVAITEDLPKKAASQNVPVENVLSSCELRRSTRLKSKPLDSWRNQRLKFAKASNGKKYECVGIDEGQPEDDFALRNLIRLKSKEEKRKVVKNMRQKNISKMMKKIPIIDIETEKIIKLQLHRPFSSSDWKLPQTEDANKPGYMITKSFKSRFMNFGFVDIAGHSMKERQRSPLDNLRFLVLKGVVEVVINETSLIVKKGDSFMVPVATFYSISNKTSSHALLSYISIRIPIFEYQEKSIQCG